MTKETIQSFSDLGLSATVLAAVENVGYEAPTPIQAEAIPPLLAGRDVLGQAQTGTGKTAAFALPVLSRLDLERKKPQTLVLTPTRELALQVAEAFQTYARGLKGFHVLPVYGGQSFEPQLRQLRRGVHAVVGTPGRILDHLRRGTLELDAVTTVVLDEADEMLRMGFIDDVEEILAQTPAEKQVALFSATMPAAIRKVTKKHLKDPTAIKIKSETVTVSSVRQRYWRVAGASKLEALTRILEVEEFDAMLIFVRTKTATVELSEKLEARGFASAPMSGDLNQALRERTVDRLRQGKLDIVVATDVAARGLDVDRLSHVVNFDVPYDVESYVHRIGRTGRAGRQGEAILFVSPRERHLLFAIERSIGQEIEKMYLPSQEDVASRRIEQFKQVLAETIDSQDLAFFKAVVREALTEQDAELEDVAGALAYLLQRERPLQPSFKKKGGPPPKAKVEGSPPSPQQGGPGSKGGRPASKRGGEEEIPLRRYRIEVGSDHGVQVKNVVGAIANEAGLDSRHIGRVEIRPDHTTVDLPDGMPREIFRHLKSVRIFGQPLGISLVGEGAAPPPSPRKKRQGPPMKKRKLKAKKAKKGKGKKKADKTRSP